MAPGRLSRIRGIALKSACVHPGVGFLAPSSSASSLSLHQFVMSSELEQLAAVGNEMWVPSRYRILLKLLNQGHLQNRRQGIPPEITVASQIDDGF